jgi:DnaK suppressor protein
MRKPAEDLSPAELKTLRAELEKARLEILQRPRPAQLGGSTPDVGDEMDTADQGGEHDESLARNQRDTARLADIDHALAKFADDRYGVSEDSGEPIGFGRLKALPWARLTVEEEERLEKGL